ncbi:hypothetical protein ACQY0O_007338 [Thecaphora frezii]
MSRVPTSEDGSKTLTNVLHAILGRLAGGSGGNAIEAASQLVLQADAGITDRLQPNELCSQEANAHMLNRLLVDRLVVPLTDLRAPRYDLLRTHPDPKAIGVAQVLETLETTMRASPKFLEHLFVCEPAGCEHGDSPARFRNTTFDVWLAPRLLSASAAAATLLIGQTVEAAGAAPLIDECLHRTIVRALCSVLEVSLEATNQVDNVRLILIEALRAAVQALSMVGSPSLMPDVVLPASVMAGWGGHEANAGATRPDVAHSDSDRRVRFFASDRQPRGFRLSSRLDRPKPSEHLVAGMTADQRASSTFTFQLTEDPRSNIRIGTTAIALLYAALELCFAMAARCPSEARDLADLAAQLLTSSWEFDGQAARAGDPHRPLPWQLYAWRYDIVSCYLDILGRLSPIAAQKLAALVAKSLVSVMELGNGEEGTPDLSAVGGARHETAALQSLERAVAALQTVDEQSQSVFLAQILPYLSTLVREVVEWDSEVLDELDDDELEAISARKTNAADCGRRSIRPATLAG